MKNYALKAISLLLTLLTLAVIPLTVTADSNSYDFSLYFTSTHFTNSKFYAYRVADFPYIVPSAEGESETRYKLTLTDGFEKLPDADKINTTFAEGDGKSVDELATTLKTALSTYNEEAKNDESKTIIDYTAYAEVTGSTDSPDYSAVAEFTSLKGGVYLIIADPVQSGNMKYTPSPILVTVPNHDTAVIKESSQKLYDEITLTVNKVWDDNNNEARPESVTVELYKDNVVNDTVVLSEENSWSYKWDRLDGRNEWTVAEAQVPDGYKVSILLDNNTYTITNTKEDIPDDSSSSTDSSSTPDTSSSVPDSSTDTSSAKDSSPDSSLSSAIPTDSTTSSKNLTITDSTTNSLTTSGPTTGDTLPQTGQLRWPIPVLLVGGTIVLIVGVLVKKANDEE